MKKNPVQFAIVREDPELEAALIARAGCERALLVASGGCTALTLQARFPSLSMTLVDPNPAQLSLVEAKVEALSRYQGQRRWERFNVGHDDPAGLCACGNFESLFRGLRHLLCEFVAPAGAWRALLSPGRDLAALEEVLGHPYWPVAFDLFFSDALLVAMFGRDAVQHAPPGSYPRYFQARLERGLRAPSACDNPFLHHIFCGSYPERAEAQPAYLSAPAPRYRITWVQGLLQDLPSFGGFGLVSLSNVMDWMAPEAVAGLLGRLDRELSPGAVVLWRQLNNDRPLTALFGPSVTFDPAFTALHRATDRSLFYASAHAGTKRPA